MAQGSFQVGDLVSPLPGSLEKYGLAIYPCAWPKPIDAIDSRFGRAEERITMVRFGYMSNYWFDARDFVGDQCDPPSANPKARFGELKPPLALVPETAIIEASLALVSGNKKYGPANWRKDPVESMTYAHAIRRHLAQWLDGEDFDKEGFHHLGAVIANAAILLDARACDTLIDNRPPPGKTAKVLAERTKPLEDDDNG